MLKYRGVVLITTADSNSARGVSEIREGEDL